MTYHLGNKRRNANDKNDFISLTWKISMTFSRELDQKLAVKVSLFEYQKPFFFLHLASVRIELISSTRLFFLREIYKTYNVENSPNLAF